MHFRSILLILFSLIISTDGLAHKKKIVSHPTPEFSSLIYNINNNKFLSAVNPHHSGSIASMTKMVTVLVVLEAKQDLDEKIKVIGNEGSSRLSKGMLIPRKDLISLALISSDNLAANTLIEHFPGGKVKGILAMNELAKTNDASTTQFKDATGILSGNVSTLPDFAKIIKLSIGYKIFADAANTPIINIILESFVKTKNQIKKIIGSNTNPFSKEQNNFKIISAKTGFTNAAGWCLSMVIEYKNNQYILATAGNKTKEARKVAMDYMLSVVVNTHTEPHYDFAVASLVESIEDSID